MFKKHWSRPVSYWEVVFTTLPGLSGLVIMASLSVVFACSLGCVRRRRWECFSYSHLLYYVFLGALFVHGFEGWFHDGLPPSALFIAVIIGAIGYQHLRRCCQKLTYSTFI